MYPSIVIMNADKDLSSNYFADADHLYVTSIFRTLQGEGVFAGRPAIFVRLAGCNFGSKLHACNGCDTSFQVDQATKYSPLELISKIDELRQPQDIIVYTGGEPTLQHLLIDIIDHYSYRVVQQLETNGTQPKFFKKLAASKGVIHVCVSPKASLKANRYAELSPEVLKLTNSLKFVVTADEASAHHTLPDWALELHKTNKAVVYVSPMAVYNKAYAGEVSSIWDESLVNKEQTSKNYAYAAEYALKHGFYLSLQTHLFVGIA